MRASVRASVHFIPSTAGRMGVQHPGYACAAVHTDVWPADLLMPSQQRPAMVRAPFALRGQAPGLLRQARGLFLRSLRAPWGDPAPALLPQKAPGEKSLRFTALSLRKGGVHDISRTLPKEGDPHPDTVSPDIRPSDAAPCRPSAVQAARPVHVLMPA